MQKRISIIITSSLAAALIAAGCGSDSSSLTKAEFIEQADVICRKADEKKSAGTERYILKTGVSPTQPMTKVQQEVLTKKLTLPPIRSAITQITELGVPDGDEETIDSLVESLEAASDKTEEESEKTNLRGRYDPYVKAAELSRNYGFKTCFVNY